MHTGLSALGVCVTAKLALAGRAGQGRAGQGMAGQGRAGQGRAGQGRAGQGNQTYLRSVLSHAMQDVIFQMLSQLSPCSISPLGTTHEAPAQLLQTDHIRLLPAKLDLGNAGDTSLRAVAEQPLLGGSPASVGRSWVASRGAGGLLRGWGAAGPEGLNPCRLT